jgi:nicotinamidase-related amidase
MRLTLPFALPALACALLALPASADGPAKFTILARKRSEIKIASRVVDPVTGLGKTTIDTQTVPTNVEVAIEPKKTAVVVCDMWDDHWCKSAATRCGELAKRAEPFLKACRQKGMAIIHCPSDCMASYKDHPARKRALAVKKAEPPEARELPNPPLPVDDTKGGCDDEKEAKFYKAWTREHAAITIDRDKDYVTDSGAEVYGILKEKGIDTLLVMGVHTNMCVLNRSFAIKQMVKWGVRTFLVRDLTDSMYSPKYKPFVSHERGTELIVEYIEKNWCPTVESKSLMK